MDNFSTLEFDIPIEFENTKKMIAKAKVKKSNIFLLFAFVFFVVFIFSTPIVEKEIDEKMYPIKYQELVEKYSSKNNLSASFVYAVIFSESSFLKDSVSNVNAIGLMQITEETFDWIKFRMQDENEENTKFNDLFDPETNIKYGTFLLRHHLDEFKTEENTLVAYHAGRGKLKTLLKDTEFSSDKENLEKIPSGQTNNYVIKVLDVKQKYEKLYFTNK